MPTDSLLICGEAAMIPQALGVGGLCLALGASRDPEGIEQN